MGDLMKRVGVKEMEIGSSLSPSKKRKLDSQLTNSPENASICSKFNSDPNKKVEDFEGEISIFNFDEFSEEITPLKEAETENSSSSLRGEELTALSSAPLSSAKGGLTPLETEIEEFFMGAEKYEQKRFSEKYNYDIVKDVPLEGRYKWVKL